MDKLIQSWFACYNNWDLKKLKSLYFEKVLYYGKNLSQEQCINEKLKFFTPHTTFTQKIVSEVSYEKNKNGIIIAKFIKRAGFNNKLQNYPSYLLIFKHSADFLIFGEGDEISDKKLNFKLNINEITNPESVLIKTPNKNINKNIFSLNWILIVLSIILITIFLIIYNFRKRKAKSSEKRKVIIKSYDKENKIEASNENKIKGRKFEEFIVTKFDKKYFELIDWRSDKFKDGIYPKSSKYPDLEYKYSDFKNSKKFAVECKYRSKKYDEVIIAELDKIKEYKRYSDENKIPVFIVLGLAGEPSNPEECYIIPLGKMYKESMKYTDLEKFRKNFNYVDSHFFFNAGLERLS